MVIGPVAIAVVHTTLTFGIGYPLSRNKFVDLYKNGKSKIHYIHKLVAREWVPNPDGKRCVDHRDGDPTNNHHENLRAATHSENLMNKKRRKDGSSAFKGVSFDKNSGKWVVRIKVAGVNKNLGLFEIERDAAEVYNAAAVKFYKEFARLNIFED